MDNFHDRAQWRKDQWEKIIEQCLPCPKTPSLDKVVRLVSDRLYRLLPKPEYRIEKKQFVADVVYFEVYKNDVLIGSYGIGLGSPGKPVYETDDPVLLDEWRNIYELILWGDLQREFGKFPWPKAVPLEESTQPEIPDIFPRPGSAAEIYRQLQYEEEKRNLNEIIELREKAQKVQESGAVKYNDNVSNCRQQEQNPWEIIPDHYWDREAIEMWCSGHTNSEIAERVKVQPRVVTNRICLLRKHYPQAQIPTHEQRRKLMIRGDMG